MSKINTSYWGANTSPYESGGYTYNYGLSTNNIRNLVANGVYDPNTDSFDLSVSPWGIGYSAAGNRGQIVIQRQGSVDGNAPGIISKISFEGIDKENSNRPFYMPNGGAGGQKDNYEWVMARVGGDCNVDSSNYIIDKRNSQILASNSSSSNCISNQYACTYLDYQKYKLKIWGFHYINLDTGATGEYYFTSNTETVEQAKQTFANWNFPEHMAIINIILSPIGYGMASGSPTQWYDSPVPGKYGLMQMRGHTLGDAYLFNKITYTASAEEKYKLFAQWTLGPYGVRSPQIVYSTIPSNYYSSSPYVRNIPVEGQDYRTNPKSITYQTVNVCGLGVGADSNYDTTLVSNYCDKEQSFSDITYKQRPFLYQVNNDVLTEIEEGYPLQTGYSQFRATSIYEISGSDTFTRDQILALIKHEVAFYGFEFYISWGNANGGTFEVGSDDLYLPKFDEHLITTGNYTSGTASLSEPNATWGNVFGDDMPDYDSEYNPSPTPGPSPRPVPDPNPNPIYPSTPSFTLAGKGTTCYALRDGDMDDILAAVFGREESDWDDLLDGLKFYGADPMAAIISYKWYPFTFNPTPEATVRLGGVEVSSTLYSYFNNVSDTLKTDSFTFWAGLDKNFVNSRHTVARLWLPFYGFYSLPIQNFISEELEVEFHYNVPDELGVWIISFGDVIYDFVECNPSIDIPLSAIDYRGQKYAQIGSFLNYGSSAITGLSGLASGVASMAIGGSLGGGVLETMRYENGYGSIGSMLKAQGVAGTMTAFDSDQVGARSALIQGAGMMGSGASQSFNSLGGAITGIANNYANTRRTLNQLTINVPLHGAAGTTTFLNLPMAPYVQIFRNIVIDDYNEGQYKLKNGHACDKWVTADSMPSNSLCQTSGIANISTSGMELSEVQELNSILQNGFFIAIE